MNWRDSSGVNEGTETAVCCVSDYTFSLKKNYKLGRLIIVSVHSSTFVCLSIYSYSRD